MAAGSDDGEHTRIRFLATVRALVATVVTVLAVAVVVMVIVVVHRPVEMAFRSNGYVQASDWWQIQANTTPAHSSGALNVTSKQKRYGPADEVDILLVLSAVNPSGRGEINGSINIIRIVDIRNMVQFCLFEPKMSDPEASVRFALPPHSSHRYRRWVNMTDHGQLQYLYDNHRQDKSGFSVLLVVETTYGRDKNMSYYCSPVTFIRIGLYPLFSEHDDLVTCMTAQDMGYKPNITSII